MNNRKKTIPEKEPDAALTGALFDKYDDWLAVQPDHKGYDAAFDRIYGRKHPALVEEPAL